MDSKQLLEQLKSGNTTEALKELYKSFPIVRAMVKNYQGNEDDARDIFQEGLVVVYKNALNPDFELKSASIHTYLVTACKYMWRDELKKRNRINNAMLESLSEPEVENHLEEEAKLKWLDKVLSKVGERCSEMLKLFYFKKCSMEEIAQKYDYKSIDTAKTQKYKCLEKARTMASEIQVLTEGESL